MNSSKQQMLWLQAAARSIWRPGLVNSYRYRNFAAGVNGQSRFQVVRVPQYTTATVTGTLTAAAGMAKKVASLPLT